MLARGAGLWGLTVPTMSPVLPVPSWGWPLAGGHCKTLDLDKSPWGCPSVPQIMWDRGGSIAEVWAGYSLLLIISRLGQLLAPELLAVPL